MRWCVLFWEKQKETWENRARISKEQGKVGHQAYAEKQVDMWRTFVTQGKAAFKGQMVE